MAGALVFLQKAKRNSASLSYPPRSAHAGATTLTKLSSAHSAIWKKQYKAKRTALFNPFPFASCPLPLLPL
ncbi:MAG TPA: hypothetical protein VM943_03875, partial [Pyrinomonadaceae bacterium]|nr:hypothetical protein [Pyrinomonadaceae bacterium]